MAPPFDTPGDSSGSDVRDTLRILRADPGAAVALLRARIDQGQADFRTWHNLAVALSRGGDTSGALEAVAHALQLGPQSAATHLLSAALLRAAGRYGEALAACARAADLDPNYPRLNAYRGAIQFLSGDAAAAAADLEAAVRADPRDAAALFNLAVVHVARKKYTEAELLFWALVDLEPGKSAHYRRFLVELGRIQALEETLSQAHRIKNFIGIVGDRLRRLCEEDLASLDRELREDLLGIRDDHARIYQDMVAFLGAIRPRPLELESADLGKLVARLVFVASAKSAGISIEKELAHDLPRITCDVDALQDAFLNILLNAIEAIGERRIGARNRGAAADGGQGGDGRVRIRAERDGDHVLVSFADDGVGIPEGELARIFDMGFTTKRLGTGIGLAYTHRVIREHGGSIAVQSREWEGTTFRVRLPIAPRPAEHLSSLTLRTPGLDDPRELILEERGEDLGL